MTSVRTHHLRFNKLVCRASARIARLSVWGSCIPSSHSGQRDFNWKSHPPMTALLPLHLIHQRPKLVNILKAAVNAGKADVSHLVELFQLAHNELANAV